MYNKNKLLEYYTHNLKTKKYLNLVQHCNQNIYLNQGNEQGKYKISRTPYMIDIAEKLSFRNRTQQVTLMSGVQMAKTTLCLNFIDYVVRFGSGNLMYVMPTDESVKNFSRVRLSKTLEYTTDLAGDVMETGSRKRNNTMLTKKFATGHLVLTGANSPIGLRAMPVKFLVMDEVDAFPLNVGNEGCPVFLAIKRTTTFALRRKILMVSTPTIKDESRIEQNYNEGTKKLYYVPCPYCNFKQVLMFDRLIYDKENLKDVKYKCIKCQGLIDEYYKNEMLKSGHWIAEQPNKKNESYKINSLYSPLGWYSWSDIATDYLESRKRIDKQQAFINTVMADTVDKNFGSVIDVNVVAVKGREKYDCECPNGVLVITAGVDVQDDRFAIEVTGWGHNEESWSLDYTEIHGSMEHIDTWDLLDKYLQRQFKDAFGVVRKIDCVALDHGGHYSKNVEVFTKIREHRRIFAIKGSSKKDAQIINSYSRKNVNKCLLYIIGTYRIKDILFRRLNYDQKGYGYCHFPDHYKTEYFEMLTSEKKVKKYKNGVFKEEYVKTRRRNEALDCRVYSYAALNILNANMIEVEKNLKRQQNKLNNTEELKIIKPKKKKYNILLNHKKGWINRF